MTNDNILKLINNNKWDKILQQIKNKKINIKEPIINSRNIIHLATLSNRSKIIDYLLKNNKESLSLIDNEGNSSVHLMAINGYDNILKKTLKINNNFINLLNNKNESVTLLMSKRGDLFNWALNNIKGININLTSTTNNNPLLSNISRTKKEGDIYDKNISIMLKNNIDFNIPKRNPPLYYASRDEKLHIVKKLLKIKNIDLNIYNSQYMTPLITSILNSNYEITKLLLENGADAKYIGGMGEFNTMIISAVRKDYKTIDLLLEHGFDPNKQNKFLDTTLHQLLYIKNFSLEYLFKVIYRSDLNIQNIDGKTALHLILRKRNWNNFKSILREKKLDIYLKNNKNEIPMIFLKEGDISSFFDVIVEGYLNQLDNKKIKLSKKCNRYNIEDDFCKNMIKKKIIKEKSSIPKNKSSKNFENNFNLIKEKFQNFGKFNSDTMHNIIYTVIFLKKYSNLMIPFKYFYEDKFKNDLYSLKEYNFYKVPEGIVINELVTNYSILLYEISPYIMVWRSNTQYYISPDLYFSFNKCLNMKSVRFIFMRLTIIPSHDDVVTGHANIIVFDKKTGILDRFEPHGNIPYLKIDILDQILKKEIGDIVENYLNDNNLKLKYIKPSDYNNEIGIQTITNEYSMNTKKLGDPGGFCLAWIYWYLEMRLKNPDINPIDIIKKSYEEIINDNADNNKKKNKTDSGDNIFINYIRNYASRLDEEKNKILLECKIDKEKIYNIVFDNNDMKKIKIGLTNIFSKILKDKI